MKVYSIYIPELTLDAQFKVLSSDEVEAFIGMNSTLDEIHYKKSILDLCVFNLQTEIFPVLKKMTRKTADVALAALFNSCVMLNPGLKIDLWINLAYRGVDVQEPAVAELALPPKVKESKRKIDNKITKDKYLNLERYLSEKIVGQSEAIKEICAALKRSHAGLSDTNRPLGVFMFCGSSGVGKTALAKELHNYLFGDSHDIIRIDCGEFQQKHENQKLIGAPPGYTGFEGGGQLTKAITEHSNSVVLIDEMEKAHTDVLNTFLRVFDEGILTDNKGQQCSFRNSIIIMTSNLGNRQISDQLTNRVTGFALNDKGEALFTKVLPKRSMVERITQEAVKKTFAPEFLNRIDKLVIFNHLTEEDYIGIADIELGIISDKLAKRGLSIIYDETVLKKMVEIGVTTVEGARGLSTIRRDLIENLLADEILNTPKMFRGTVFEIMIDDDKFKLVLNVPKKKEGNDASELSSGG